MTYTVKNQKHDQDNINFIDVLNAKKDIPSFLNYKEVLDYSIRNCNISDESEIVSVCDGGNHVNAYFSSMSAADECEIYLGDTPFYAYDDKGNEVEKTLEFDYENYEYELY